MLVSEKALKWAMRFYPPLLFQRIWVKRFLHDFRGVDVKLFKSILNINYNRSIFGGTIYSAADPFYPVLFHQALKRRGYNVIVWLKAAEIDFIKPGRSSLYFCIRLSEQDIDEACQTLDRGEKFIKAFSLDIADKEGEVCARLVSTVYVRKR